MMDRLEGRCPECGASVGRRSGEAGRTSLEPLEALEAQVPDTWVSSMWGDVRGAVRERRRMRRPGRRWAAPLLVAASVALLFANGLALRALRQAEGRTAALSEQLIDQQRRLSDFEAPAASRFGRAERLTGRDAWLRALSEREDLTVADLRALLSELPAGTPVTRTSRPGALRGARLPAAWQAALTRLDAEGDVTVADVLDVLDELDLPEGTAVPTARLIELLS